MSQAIKNRPLNLATQFSFSQSPVPLLTTTHLLVCLISWVLKGLCLASKALPPNPHVPSRSCPVCTQPLALWMPWTQVSCEMVQGTSGQSRTLESLGARELVGRGIDSHPGILNPPPSPPCETARGCSEPSSHSVPGTGSTRGCFSSHLLLFGVLGKDLGQISIALRRTQDPYWPGITQHWQSKAVSFCFQLCSFSST